VQRHRTRRRDGEDPPRQLRIQGLEVLRGLDDDDLLAREVAAELGAHGCVDGLAAHAVESLVDPSGLHQRRSPATPARCHPLETARTRTWSREPQWLTGPVRRPAMAGGRRIEARSVCKHDLEGYQRNLGCPKGVVL